jgi:hypothetical protein
VDLVVVHHEIMLQEPYLAAIRSRLDEASWEAAFAEGRAMWFEEVIEYAFSVENQATPSGAPEHPAGLTPREMEVLRLVAVGMNSSRVTAESALPIASMSASRLRASALRRSPLISEKASSMGLKSGE